MVKRLTKHGNSLALAIDADTPLLVTTDGKCLIVTPVRDPEIRKNAQASGGLADVARLPPNAFPHP